MDLFYRRFYFRPRKMISLGGEMAARPPGHARRLSEGRDFLKFLRRTGRRSGAAAPHGARASMFK